MNQAVEILAKIGTNTAVSLDALPAHIAAMFEAKDIEALKDELDVAPKIVCALFPAEDDNDQSENEQDDAPAKEEISACA
ncbi:hypothetical protein [Shewanella litorisediminis]|uniref:Uncharacterized protein n=1 Tax=Shewanella litorisediminis TaxID=1173586 RepID=A0ABX7G5F0_9GAMM|nr:hypothetical protein [Shewanella litorisediminis]MCL2917403.1 hypothetical protein [Shewanella litorisediminis]QRH02536.1 hypothetical protein JQC75_03695 [Shewanella litorisediminis]